MADKLLVKSNVLKSIHILREKLSHEMKDMNLEEKVKHLKMLASKEVSN